VIPISIDISETIEEFSLTTEEIKLLSNYILDRVATEYVVRWEEQIDQNLKSTRQEYKRGIFQEQSADDNSITIGLTPRQSPMSLMLEEGASQFDEKLGFADSPKKHIGKNGKWYISVPFRYATAEALGESAIFSGQLPKPIQNLVKQSSSPITIEQIKGLPGSLGAVRKNLTSGYQHKFNIYEGLQRIEVGSGTEKRGAYMNFRRVSENSDPAAWIHPGFEAKKLMDKAVDQTDFLSIVDDAVNEFLSNR